MLLEWVFLPYPREESNSPPTFRELQQITLFVLWNIIIGVPLPVPTKSVIGNCLPSSRTLLSRTQMVVSHANIITWDVFLRSLLSCLTQQLLTSKSVLRHQPKRFFSSGYHCWSSTKNAVSHILFVIWLGPSHQQDDIHWVPMCLQFISLSIGSERTPFVLTFRTL